MTMRRSASQKGTTGTSDNSMQITIRLQEKAASLGLDHITATLIKMTNLTCDCLVCVP